MTATVTEDITHLDFQHDEDVPCETTFHDDVNPPAEWFITVHCSGCPTHEDYAICSPCLWIFTRADIIDCTVCGAEYTNPSAIITNVRNIKP